jgi:hypothetical protein
MPSFAYSERGSLPYIAVPLHVPLLAWFVRHACLACFACPVYTPYLLAYHLIPALSRCRSVRIPLYNALASALRVRLLPLHP